MAAEQSQARPHPRPLQSQPRPLRGHRPTAAPHLQPLPWRRAWGPRAGPPGGGWEEGGAGPRAPTERGSAGPALWGSAAGACAQHPAPGRGDRRDRGPRSRPVSARRWRRDPGPALRPGCAGGSRLRGCTPGLPRRGPRGPWAAEGPESTPTRGGRGCYHRVPLFCSSEPGEAIAQRGAGRTQVSVPPAPLGRRGGRRRGTPWAPLCRTAAPQTREAQRRRCPRTERPGRPRSGPREPPPPRRRTPFGSRGGPDRAWPSRSRRLWVAGEWGALATSWR